MVFRQKRRDSEVNGGVKAWLSRCFEVVASAGSREFVVSAKPGWCDSKPFVNRDPWVVISGDPARASAQQILYGVERVVRDCKELCHVGRECQVMLFVSVIPQEATLPSIFRVIYFQYLSCRQCWRVMVRE